MDFEPKFKKFKIHKNFYMGPLCITDLEFGLHDQENLKFRSDFVANSSFSVKLNVPLDFEVKFEKI
jgi:hypothetical protein